MIRHLPPILAALLSIATPVLGQAEDVHANGVEIDDGNPASAGLFVDDEVSVNGLTCLGFLCVDEHPFDDSEDGTLTLYDALPFIDFFDGTDLWSLGPFIADAFAIGDATVPSAAFAIMHGAPHGAFTIAADGNIGIGTTLPGTDLHIVDGTTAEIRLERDTSEGFAHQSWELFNNGSGMGFYDATGFRIPFLVQTAAPDDALVVASSGRVGIGTDAPDAPLEIADNDAFSFFRITAQTAPINQSVDIVFTKGPLNTGQLRYNIVDGDGPEMRLNANGDMTIAGTLTTAGPTCAAGCDRVFAPDYPLPSIAEHAAAMRDLGHLPAVGPTAPGAPLNVPEKIGAMINELEHAHLYIADLQRQLAAQQATIAALSAEVERLGTLLAP